MSDGPTSTSTTHGGPPPRDARLLASPEPLVPRLCLRVSTPAQELVFTDVQQLRFPAGDGSRGVLPGHEPARVILLEGALRFVEASDDRAALADDEPPAPRWLATEGGLVLIDRHEVRVLTRWAAVADSLARLRALVDEREQDRSRIEQSARALAERHEHATRRALIALERKVVMP